MVMLFVYIYLIVLGIVLLPPIIGGFILKHFPHTYVSFLVKKYLITDEDLEPPTQP